MKSLDVGKSEFLRMLSARIVPESTALDAAGWARFEAIVDDALQERTDAVRRQLALFLGVLRWAPVARYGARFDARKTYFTEGVIRNVFSLLPAGDRVANVLRAIGRRLF